MPKLAAALRAFPFLIFSFAQPVSAQSMFAQPASAQPVSGRPASGRTPPPAPYERPALVRPSVPDQITASISAGASLNSGNTTSYAGTAGVRFQLIRQPNQLSLEVMGTYTASRGSDEEIHPTARNIVGRARYDIFLSDNNALFAAIAPRRDRFAGLDLRLQTQAGYLRKLYQAADNHRLWIELGYDGTYDNFTPWLPFGATPPAERPPASEFIHSGRAFMGYTNLLTPLAALNLGVELLYDFEDPDNIRVSTTAELTSSLSARFKLGILSRILYDRVPVSGKETTDYITTAQLVFTYDSIDPPPPCPPCDCSKDVASAKAACKQDLTVSPADLGGTPGGYVPVDEPSAPAPAPGRPEPARPAPAKPTP